MDNYKLKKDKYSEIAIEQLQFLIEKIKYYFQKSLAKNLNLIRVSAPIFLNKISGLSDDLSGTERKVEFDIKSIPNSTFEVCQSLAKWKRYALKKYGFNVHNGLYTDMLAIRRDDLLDELHSAFVDQYDWEKRIDKNDVSQTYLEQTVCNIVKAIKQTSNYIKRLTKLDLPNIKEKIYFINSQQLLDMYPNLSAKEREYEIVKKYKTVFISQIGYKLSNGLPHDLRAPDYDNFKLNGDLFFYHEVLDTALEISSMGIRVDADTLVEQLREQNALDKLQFYYHQQILNNNFPLSIGGGIGQSRLCMLLLGRAHIGEVQVSEWTDEIIEHCKHNKIRLL